MAFSNILLPIKAVFDDKGLKQAQSQFGKLGKGLKTALGVAGVAVGFTALASALQASAKAAAEDVKSQALLANGLRNSVGATNEQIASVEESIRQMQLSAAVADDQIRPAFDNLARATGDLGEATRLTNIALDVSAATGKDLGSVSIALGKAVNGSTTALSKLGLNVKGVADPIGLLEQRFKGASEAAASNDPFQRLAIIFDDMREQVGQYLLPMLNDLADYFASAEFGDAFDKLAFSVGKAIEQIDTLFRQMTGENALTWMLNTVSEIIYQVFRLIKSFSLLGEMFGQQMQAWLSGDWAKAMDSNYWLKWVKEQMAAFDKAWTRETSTTTVKPFDPFSSGTYTGGGGGGGGTKGGLTDAQKRAIELAKKQAEAYKKILETEAKIREEAVAAAQETNNATLAMRDSFTALLAGVAPLKRAGDAIGEFEQQVVDSFAAVEEAITSAVADGTLLSDAADALRSYALAEKNILAGIARQRDALTKKIDIAKAISSGVVSVANLTGLLETQTRTVTESFTQMVNGIKVVTSRSFEEITQGGLIDNFKKVIDKTKAYAKNLIELKRLGLNGQLFKQLVDAGVDGGSEAAKAIADGGQATVTELNLLFGELNQLGANIAETSTDIMFAAGEDTMNSFIAGLLAQDAALEATAISLADKFAQTFRSRLVGLTPLQAMPMNTSDISLSDAMQGYVADQLGRTFTGPYNYYGQQMVGGLGSNYNININAGVVTNKAELGDVLASTLKQYVRVNGPIGIS